MPVTVYTEAQWQEHARTTLQRVYTPVNGKPGKRTDPLSFLGQEAQAWGEFAALLSKAIQDADKDGIPAYQAVNGVLQSQNSTQALDNWSYTFGLPSNIGPGRFGRNGPQVATGGAGPVTGTPGTVVPAGALLTLDSVVVSVVVGFTIPISGTYAAAFQAQSTGAAGNLPANTVLAFSSPPSGVLPTTVTLSTGLSGGYDIESDLDLLVRLLRFMQNKPKGGTASDYRTWAEESTNLATGALLGISRAYIYPRRSGLGTEDIVITQGGSGQGRIPSAGIAAVQAYIDSVRPNNDSPTVINPYFNAMQKLTLASYVKPGVNYGFDWNDAPVALGTSTDATHLKLATTDYAASVTLSAAIANGKNPRIALYYLSGPFARPAPYVVTALSQVSGAGTTTILLALNSDGSNPLPAVAPAAAVIYPAGGATLPVALAQLAFIDSIGPSQASGWQDVITDSWVARLTIAGLAQAALDATDALGFKVLSRIDNVWQNASPGNVQIQVGSNSFTSLDFTLSDNIPSTGPQLPEAVQILVLPG